MEAFLTRISPGTQDQSNLESHLSTVSNAIHWLQVTSKHDLDNAVQHCIRKIVRERYPMPLGISSTIQLRHADQLLQEIQAALDQAERKLSPGKICCNTGSSFYSLKAGSIYAGEDTDHVRLSVRSMS